MLKWFATAAVLLLALMLAMSELRDLHRMRRVSMAHGRFLLKISYEEYVRNGAFTNLTNALYQVWLASNTVTISGTQYTCCIAVRKREYGTGVLAMTTNNVFIWSENGRSAKVIEPNYRPRLFPPGF